MNWYHTAQNNQNDPNEIMWDAANGIGQTPNNMDVDYKGYKTKMSPKEFQNLALPGVSNEKTKDFVIQAVKEGKKFGQPTLYKQWMEEELGKQIWAITSHEGRSRSKAFETLFPNQPMEVHVIFTNGLRAKDVTPEMMNSPTISETEYNAIIQQQYQEHKLRREKELEEEKLRKNNITK